MGFFSKTPAAPDIDHLKAELEKKPKDTRLMVELVAALKEKGLIAAAVDLSVKAGKIHLADGFAQKAVAVAKQAMSFAPSQPEPLQLLVECYQALKLKEDERGALRKLLKVYGGSPSQWPDEIARANARLEELGPSR